VDVVAVFELASSVDEAAAAIANDLGVGVTAYEVRLQLTGGLPAVVLTTADRARALDLLSKLRARGHSALACDGGAVLGSASMVSMRRFRLDEAGVQASDRPEGDPNARLPYDDVLALLPASHRTRVEKTTEVKDKRFDMTRAIMTSGIVLRKTTTRDVVQRSELRERVLYVFRRSGATPWILHEAGTNYAALGAHLRPSQYENFLTALGILRERAAKATYDDRLTSRRNFPERATLTPTGGGRSHGATLSSDYGVDLAAHLLALWIAKTQRPYRDP
jgi:hypothetical protein